jgi:hypothetical protein
VATVARMFQPKRMMARNYCVRRIALAVCATVLTQMSLAQSGNGTRAGNGDALDVSLSEQFFYDDNLFRLPLQYPLGAVLSRRDHVNTLSAGANYQWTGWQQEVEIALQTASNRFVRNSFLDNNSGRAKLVWNWLLGPRLSGTAGGDYSRSLAQFANTFYFAKDVVDVADYYATARLRFAQHWNITGGLKKADTTHGALERKADNFHSKSVNGGVEYVTSSSDSLSLSYQFINGSFSQFGSFEGLPFDRSYKDNHAQLAGSYFLGGRTQLTANVGYLRRRYPDSQFGSFSGDTWRIRAETQLTGKSSLSVSAWRELSAYLDAESDYFVARGESLALNWLPTSKISLSLFASYAEQSYLSTSPSAIIFDSRRDRVESEGATFSYAPRKWLNLQISYRHEGRDSNRDLFNYGDNLTGLQLTTHF